MKSTLGEEKTTLFVITLSVFLIVVGIIYKKSTARNYQEIIESFKKEVDSLWAADADPNPAGKDHLSLLMLANMRKDFSQSKKTRDYFIGLLRWLKKEHFIADKKLLQQFINETVRLFKK